MKAAPDEGFQFVQDQAELNLGRDLPVLPSDAILGVQAAILGGFS